jgi:hypothetical protein
MWTSKLGLKTNFFKHRWHLNGFSFNAKPFNHAKLNYIVLIMRWLNKIEGKILSQKKRILKKF